MSRNNEKSVQAFQLGVETFPVLDYNEAMRYSLHIIAISNPRAFAIVARHIAGKRAVSLHYAKSLLENFPVVYETDLTKEDAEAGLRQLTKIGVKARLVPDEPLRAAAKENQLKRPLPPSHPPVAPPPVPATQRGPVAPFTYTEKDAAGSHPHSVGRTPLIIGGAALAIAMLGAGFFLFVGPKWRLALRPSSSPVSKTDSGSKKAAQAGVFDSGRDGADTLAPRPPRQFVSMQAKIKAQAYADSAKNCSGTDDAVAFYKIAIGCNRYNRDAWYGLINAYMRSGMTAEASAAQEEMKKMFGGEAFSLSKIVERYGALIDADLAGDGTYRIEYRSGAADTATLLHETFQIVKAFGMQCGCNALSVYAHHDDGSGVLAYTPVDPPPATFEQFQSKAIVRRLESMRKKP